MKKGDLLWALALGVVLFILFYPATHNIFVGFTSLHPYISGFIKFAILATMGELLAIRITTGDWKKPAGMIYRAIIWGFLGMVIVLVFDIFAGGVTAAMEKGSLPFKGNSFAFALFVSTSMNLSFAPAMMGFHKITDTYIDLKYANNKMPSLKEVVSAVDWYGFISFTLIKTLPLFWIPAHTITFMLPGEYRVIVAALLSIALGLILSFAKKKTVKK